MLIDQKQNTISLYLSLDRKRAKNLVKRKVRKGSLIWVSGSLELEEYTRNNGETHDKRLKLKLGDWDYIPAFQGKTECDVPQSGKA